MTTRTARAGSSSCAGTTRRRPIRSSTSPPTRPFSRTSRQTATHVRYLSLTEADQKAMLAAIGVSSVDELFDDIPKGVRLDRPPDLEPPLSEAGLVGHLEELAGRNV